MPFLNALSPFCKSTYMCECACLRTYACVLSCAFFHRTVADQLHKIKASLDSMLHS